MKIQKSAPGLMFGAMILAALVPGLSVSHAAPRSKIGSARANSVVLKRYPGKLAAKTTLENEEGRWQYGVMVRSGKTLREVMVDAYTGKIADVEVTTAAKEKAEEKQSAASAKAKGHSKPSSKEADEKGGDED